MQARPLSVLELDRAPHRGLGDSSTEQLWDMHPFRSELMDNTRRIWTWRSGTAPRGVLLFHDGYGQHGPLIAMTSDW